MVKSLSVLVNFLVYILVFENWAFSRYFFWLGQNFCLHDTSLGSSTCTLHMLLTTLMELPHIDDRRDEILGAAKIKILAPQKLAKDCLSDVGFPPFLTKHKAMLVRFKRTIEIVSARRIVHQRRHPRLLVEECQR